MPIQKGEGVESIIKIQIDELSKEISQGIGISSQKIKAAKFQAVDVTTSSMEAYTYYLKGVESSYLFDKQREFYEKAVELDPTFASAYSGLAFANHWLGNFKARDEAIEKAISLSGKATEKERFWINANYAGYIEKNPEKRIQILKQIAKKYPKEKGVHYSLGLDYCFKKLEPEAIEELNKVLELDPHNGDAYNILGYIHADRGDYEKAIECIRPTFDS